MSLKLSHREKDWIRLTENFKAWGLVTEHESSLGMSLG